MKVFIYSNSRDEDDIHVFSSRELAEKHQNKVSDNAYERELAIRAEYPENYFAPRAVYYREGQIYEAEIDGPTKYTYHTSLPMI